MYRPPQWVSGPQIAQTVVVVFPGQPTKAQYSSQGITATLPTSQTQYVFDAVLRVGHEQSVTKTQQPIQTGAAASDHAYVNPARLPIEVGMSDAMDAYAAGLWVGARTKSISCFQVMTAMLFARIPMTVYTKLRTYANMIVARITAEETMKTVAGLRMRVEFEQLFVANTETVPDSARPQDTDSTDIGTVTTSAPTQGQISQHEVTEPVSAHVQGLMPWSSDPLSPVPAH
jgi:hypothetical protein